MDRQTLTRAACGLMLSLAVAVAAPGCKSTRSEVPPGRSYAPDGRQMPAGSVGFSSDAHPMAGNALSGLPSGMTGTPGGMPSPSNVQFGTPTPNMNATMGAPTAHTYGPPGTAGASPSLGIAPSADPTANPGPTIPMTPPAGIMGSPAQGPSPN